MTHPRFRAKLEAVGLGVLIPFFFVTSGMELDLDVLFSGAESLLPVPISVLVLLLVRGLPAVLDLPLVGTQGTVAALILAGLFSVVLFLLVALALLRGGGEDSAGEL